MKQIFKKVSFLVLAAALVAPVALHAQDDKDKMKEKTKSDGADQIIITRKANSEDKVVIEVSGDKVLINGKPIDEYKGDDISVRRGKSKDVWAFDGNGFSGSWNDNFSYYDVDANRAMLGVTTEKDAKGAEIQTVTKESGAEKAGLKKGDIITSIGEKKIEGPDDLSSAIKSRKPGEKVSVSFIRDGKAQKVTAELGKFKGVRTYNVNIPNMELDHLPRVRTYPRVQGQNWNWSGGNPKLGLFVQDTEDGKGVKVIDVDEDSNAGKAGVKEDDIITEIDGKAVNSADEVVKIVREGKDKTSLKLKLQRNGKTENVEVKIPKKLKTADL